MITFFVAHIVSLVAFGAFAYWLAGQMPAERS